MEATTLTTMSSDLQSLVQRIREGDTCAERELLDKYYIIDRIRMMISRKLIASDEDKSDLLIEIASAFIISLREGMYDPNRGNLGSYLWGITSNRIGKYLRRKERRRIMTEMVTEPVATRCSSDTLLERAETQRRLKRLIGRLDSKYQQVILLRYYQELAIPEIAEQLNIGERQVYNRIHYALRLLGNLM